MADNGGHFELSVTDYMNPLYAIGHDATMTKGTSKAPSTKIQADRSDTKPSNGASDQKTLPHSGMQRMSLKESVTRCGTTINCPEKLIICLDISSEMVKSTFRSKTGEKQVPLKLIKRALGIFIHTKYRLNKNHQFALILLRDNAILVCECTNNPEKIITIMNEMKETSSTETCDLASVFDNIQEQVELPQVAHPTVDPPPFTVRVILIYGRSHCKPHFSSQKSLKELCSSPHFFLDCYYIHEPPSVENQCEEIFNSLCNLDITGLSYIFEVSGNPTRVYDNMARLLAHPLQRPIQNDICNSIESRDDQQKTKD